MKQKLDLSAALDLIKDLATVPGPSLKEEPRISFLAEFFSSRSIPFQVDSAGNLLVLIGEGSWEDTIVLDAHVDVVGKGVADKVERTDGRLVGAGVYDNLGTVALLAMFAVYLSKNPPVRPALFLFSVGEEGLGNLKGVRAIVDSHPTPPHLFLALDLSPNFYSVSGLGSIRYQVVFSGEGGHSWGGFGKPNAIESLVDYLFRLKERYCVLSQQSKEKFSFNIGTISGGEGVNCIARHAESVFEFRSPDPEMLSAAKTLLEELSIQKKSSECTITLKLLGERPAAFSDKKTSWYEKSIVDLWTIDGISPLSACRSTNINIPLAKGWPAICSGITRGGNTHREDEYLEIDSLEEGWNFLFRFAEKELYS